MLGLIMLVLSWNEATFTQWMSLAHTEETVGEFMNRTSRGSLLNLDDMDDSAIVSDDGKVFIRVDKTMVEKPKSGKGVLVRMLANQAAVLKRCLRWSKIIKELYDFEQEVEDDISTDAEEDVDDMEVVLPSPKKEPNLKLTPPDRKRKLSMRRYK